MLSTRSTWRAPAAVVALVALALLGGTAQALAQGATGSITGKVSDERAAPLAGAQVLLQPGGKAATSNSDGTYLLEGVPVGSRVVRIRLIGFRSQTRTVTVTAGQRHTLDFTMLADPLHLEAVVVTGTATPRTKLETTNATTVLSAAEVFRAAPRSTTEFLRYVPGFTRVESSGGEVNENYTMRGILGVEYVMFMEDGLPVYPTMHTFFMNADNLFRNDDNIERIEVVRGGGSALFGSNTPGAIVNYINKTGGPEFGGSLRVTAATQGLARNDLNFNGPLGEDWRFNFGAFYRYDHGTRNPGFPGIRGGQFKASMTHQVSNGYLRASVKYIDDRNQFILPLPFQDPNSPKYVPGFSDYGSMNTNEGNHVVVPIPSGQLELPLDDGIRTKGYWLTADASFDMGNAWNIRNTAQVMQDNEAWNAILPFDVVPDSTWIKGLGLVADSTKLYFTNVYDVSGKNRVQFNTANHLVSPGGEWHIAKPISAFQNQLQVRKQSGPNTLSAGLYFANYTQENHWYFTDILMDVRDNPHFLDLIAFQGANTLYVTKNGFRNFLSLYRNASGQTTVLSPVLGGSLKLNDRARADVGFRYEWDYYVQSAENTSTIDLDNNAATKYNNETFGNGTFRHFSRTIGDWAASGGVNYSLTDQTSVYAQGARGYKMPALDEFIDPTAQGQVDALGARRTVTAEGGVKHASRRAGVAVNAFYTLLQHNVGQGLVTINGVTSWVSLASADVRAYGIEVEASASPTPGLSLLGSGTILKSDISKCPDSTATSPATPCAKGAGVGTFLSGVPPVIGNLSATYATVSGINLVADLHFVGRRYSSNPDSAGNRNKLPTYSYANLSATYSIPKQGITLSAAVLNVYQAKGLEEGNPRLSLIGGRTSNLYLARPILPRRFQASVAYQF
jgi:outer membrane receptor protein involved in Fe transport